MSNKPAHPFPAIGLTVIRPVAGKGCAALLLITVTSSAKQADALWGFCCAEQHMCAFLCMNTHQKEIAHEALTASITGVSLVHNFSGSHKWQAGSAGCQVGALPIIFFAGQPTPTVEMSPLFSSLQPSSRRHSEAWQNKLDTTMLSATMDRLDMSKRDMQSGTWNLCCIS